MTTLAEEIAKAVQEDPTGEPLVLAERLIGRFKRNDFLGLLADAIALEQRRLARAHEANVWRRALAPTIDKVISEHLTPASRWPVNTNRTKAESVDAFRELFGKRFALGNGVRVTWDQATVEEHELRIAMLEKKRAGLSRTVDLHRFAVDRLKASGARCLADLATVAAAA